MVTADAFRKIVCLSFMMHGHFPALPFKFTWNWSCRMGGGPVLADTVWRLVALMGLTDFGVCWASLDSPGCTVLSSEPDRRAPWRLAYRLLLLPIDCLLSGEALKQHRSWGERGTSPAPWFNDRLLWSHSKAASYIWEKGLWSGCSLLPSNRLLGGSRGTKISPWADSSYCISQKIIKFA